MSKLSKFYLGVAISFGIGFLMLGLIPITKVEAASVDQYGGLLSVVGTNTGKFHTEKIGNRWWMVTPAGHGMFAKNVIGVDSGDWNGYGDMIGYDAVYLKSGTTFSSNLSTAAFDTFKSDVIHPTTKASLSAVGDEIYIGYKKKFEFPYFWLNQLGVGGKISWYYSKTGNTWGLINGTGNPFTGSKVNTDGSYNFDIGNFMAPNSDGWGDWNNLNANRLKLWNTDVQGIFPSDFAQTTAAGNATPLYYIKGVVTQSFTTAPILNQVYERADVPEALIEKYGGGPNVWATWADQQGSRLKSWGFNGTGMYSNRYWGNSQSSVNRLPMEPTWQISDWTVRDDYPWHVRNVMKDSSWTCPGTSSYSAGGSEADAFDPRYVVGINGEVDKNITSINSQPWNSLLVPDEADTLYGIDAMYHEHLGWVVATHNPYKVADSYHTDTKLYAKYAMRDYLRNRYKDASDAIQPFTVSSAVPAYSYATVPSGLELKALQNLNAAWGTSYTTWDTSSGSLTNGTNAYGTGTGFMDENGKHIFSGSRCDFVTYNDSFATATVRKDLDDYVALFAARYGSVLAAGFNRYTHPPIFAPIYGAPSYVYGALAPYVEGFFVSGQTPDNTQKVITNDSIIVNSLTSIYNASHKPMIYLDYFEATPDSPSFFSGTVSSLTYDPTTNRTRVYAPGLEYVERTGKNAAFQELTDADFNGGKCGWALYPWPPIRRNDWNSIDIDGNFTVCATPGMHIELSSWNERYPYRTREAEAQAMVNRYNSLLNLKGDDGNYFLTGLEHWALRDFGSLYWAEIAGFGLVTPNDNAYDGVEAKKAAGVDTRGYTVGGEQHDYGNLLGTLSPFLTGLEGRLLYSSTATTTQDTTPPSAPANLVATPVSSSQISLSWSPSTDNVSVTGYGIMRNGVQIGTALGTSYDDSSLQASTLYTYQVYAYDLAGNKSALSSSATASTAPVADTIPPSVSITAPLSNATVQGTISVSANATDNISIQKVDFQVDGATFLTDASSPYAASLDTTKYANGSHVITAIAYDSSSNQSASSVTVNIQNQIAPDTTAPVISGISVLPSNTNTVITWNTNELSTSGADIGTSSSYTQSSSTSVLVNSHKVSFAGLMKGTLYHYRLHSKDAAGNEAVSGDLTFSTLGRLNKPPRVQNIQITFGSVIIKWDKVNYPYLKGYAVSKGTASYQTDPKKATQLNQTTYVDKSVTPGQTYYYTVWSVDDKGVYSDPVQVKVAVPNKKKVSSVDSDSLEMLQAQLDHLKNLLVPQPAPSQSYYYANVLENFKNYFQRLWQ